MKVLFLGTPEFAVPSLEALLRSDHEVVGVVTQPDRALKRGKREAGAVKLAAEKAGLRVFQPERIADAVDAIKAFGADIGVTAAYGQLLTAGVLDAFPSGVINVHASVLPKYRGASPIASAIANGETETGVTIMRTELGLDTGDILAVAKTPIAPTETAGELTVRLADMGAALLVKTLDGFDGISPIKQDDAAATRCRTLKKSDLFIDFDRDVFSVINQIRALSPSPCARTVIDGEVYKIYRASVPEAITLRLYMPGEIIRCDKDLLIACGSSAISVERIQAPSKNALDIADFLRGKRFREGTVCGKV